MISSASRSDRLERGQFIQHGLKPLWRPEVNHSVVADANTKEAKPDCSARLGGFDLPLDFTNNPQDLTNSSATCAASGFYGLKIVPKGASRWSLVRVLGVGRLRASHLTGRQDSQAPSHSCQRYLPGPTFLICLSDFRAL